MPIIYKKNMIPYINIKPMVAVIETGAASAWVLSVLHIITPVLGAIAAIVLICIYIVRLKKESVEKKNQQIEQKTKEIQQQIELMKLEHLKQEYRVTGSKF